LLRSACILAALAAVIAVAQAGAAGAEPAAATSGARFEVVAGTLTRNRPPRPPDAPAGVNWWHYDVTVRETSGRSGVTLTGWRKCYIARDSVGCEKVRDNFVDLFGANRVPAGGAIRLKRPAWVWADKTGDTYGVEATYWGLDDAGHEVRGGYRFKVRSDRGPGN